MADNKNAISFEEWSQGGTVKPVNSSTLRKAADIPLKFAGGAVGAAGSLADAFGADNAVARGLKGFNKSIDRLTTPESQIASQRQGEILEGAKGKSVGEQLVAGGQAFAEAPLDTIAQGAGSIAPFIAAQFIPGVGQSATAARAAQLGMGVGMGLGSAKGSIYDEVQKRGIAAGKTPEQAKAEAEAAQAYGGGNTDQIALGGALGAADTLLGATPAAVRLARGLAGGKVAGEAATGGLIKAGVNGALGEAPTEFAQGAQEQVAANIAAQRAGYDAGTWDGAVAKGTLEGLASAGPGAGLGMVEARGANINAQRTAQERESAQAQAEALAAEQARVDAEALRAQGINAQSAMTAAPGVEFGMQPASLDAAALNAAGVPTPLLAPVLDAGRIERMADLNGAQPVQPPVQQPEAAPAQPFQEPTRPSVLMGLNPSAGPISAAAALSVDAGYQSPAVRGFGLQRGAGEFTDVTPITPVAGQIGTQRRIGETPIIDVQSRIIPDEQQAIGAQQRIGFNQPQGAIGATQTTQTQQAKAQQPQAQPAPAVAAALAAPVQEVVQPPVATQPHPQVTPTQPPVQAQASPAVQPQAEVRTPSSWVIRNKETGEVIMETFDRKKVDALNTAKYEAVPIRQHLEEKAAQIKAQAAPEAAQQPLKGAENGQGQETLLNAAQTTGAAAMVSGEPAAEQPNAESRPSTLARVAVKRKAENLGLTDLSEKANNAQTKAELEKVSAEIEAIMPFTYEGVEADRKSRGDLAVAKDVGLNQAQINDFYDGANQTGINPNSSGQDGLTTEILRRRKEKRDATATLSATPRSGLEKMKAAKAKKENSYATKAEADKARKLQPMMKAVKVGKRYQLVEKTPAEIAAQENAARKNLGATGGKGPRSAHAFIAASGGINMAAMSDMGFDKNVRVGAQFMFKKTGMTLDRMTEALQQEGYIPRNATLNDAIALVQKSAKGQPQYTAEGWSQIAEAEAATRFEDHLAAQQDAATAMSDEDIDPFSPDALFGEFNGDDMVVSGYDEAADPIKVEVNALLAQAEAKGIDTDTIKENAHYETRNESDQAYYERIRADLNAALTQGAGSVSNAADVQNADGRQGQEAQRAGGVDRVKDAGQQGDAAGLTAPTKADIEAQQERAAQADLKAKKDKAAQEAKARTEREKKEIAAASVAAADTFELGGDAMANLSGQEDIFGGAVEPATESKFAKYDDEAKLYGYTVDASGAIFKGSKKLSPVVKEAKGRLRVEAPDGSLLFSGAQTGGAFGEFLKSFWNAEKVGGDAPLFSRAEAKELRNLVTLHNLSEENLMYAGKMGGIPVPSIGITKVDSPFGGFGGITLIAPKDLIDPESGVPVYDRDAWTARFPALNFKKVKAKVADAFYERMSAASDLGGDGSQFMSSLFDELKNARVQSPDKITSLFMRYSAPKMLYAQEVLGKTIKPQMRGIKPETPFGHTKTWRDFVAKSDTRNMTEQREREFNREAAVAARAAMVELGEASKEGVDERTARMLDSSLKSYLDRYITEDGMNAGILDRALRDVKSFGQKEIDPMKMDEAVRKVVPLDDAGYKKWVAGLVEPLFEAPTITVRGSEVPVTLENVVDAMTIGKTAGAEKSMTFGVGKAASMLGKQFKSIDEIKAARDRVVSTASESEGKKSTEALISEYQNHVSTFYTGKDWKGNIDTWAALDSSLEALTKAGRAPTDAAMNIALQRSGFKRVDAKGISLARQALEALRDATTDYFEAKPQRAVRLNEFKGAVVPKGTSAEAIALLEENGITVEVHGNAEGAREKAIQKLAKKLDAKSGEVIFSQGGESAPTTPTTPDRSVPAIAQTTALNSALVRYGLGAEWKNAYEPVTLPDALSGIGKAFQAAFGRNIRAVAPTAPKFNVFNGVFLPSHPKTVFVNANAKPGFVQIAGHELWHDIARSRPDLIKWYRSVAAPYYKNFPAYQSKLNSLLQQGEKPYSADKALEELEADVLGDSLADQKFLQALADSSPGKFRQLLLMVQAWLKKVAGKLTGLGSEQYVTDLDELRGHLKDVLVAFSDGKPVPPTPGGGLSFQRDSEVDYTNIRFSRADNGGALPALNSEESNWDSPIESKWDDYVFKLQDKNIDLKRVTQGIVKWSGQLADNINAYLQEELYHGRSAKRVQEFSRLEMEPALKALAAGGYQIEDIEEYMHARHAKEANAVMAQRNPTQEMIDAARAAAKADIKRLKDALTNSTDKAANKVLRADLAKAQAELKSWRGAVPFKGTEEERNSLSGMSNASADSYFAKLPAADKKALGDVAAMFDAVMAGTNRLMVEYELESQDTIDGWGEMYQNYIPLHREDKDDTRQGTGQGFSIKGRETKGRTGSTRKVVNVLAHIAAARERTIVRGEKNRVSQALVGMVKAYQNDDVWKIGSPEYERVFNPSTGKVTWQMNPAYKSLPNVVVAKVLMDGEVKEVAVTLNEDNPRAVRLAAALKNLDAPHIEGWLGTVQKMTRYFASINTQYNPVFGVVNVIRDVQGAMINLGATPLADQKAAIARDSFRALLGIYQDIRATRRGELASSQWSKLYDQFQHDGGQTGFRNLFETAEDRANDLLRIVEPDAWAKSGLGKFFTADGKLLKPASMLRGGFRVVFDWLSDYNEAMESGVRLAAYKAALDKGMTRDQAASLAKNLTVNFNRKGQAGTQIGAVYAFFNAAVQGTARLGETLMTMEPGKPKTMRLSKYGKAVVQGGLLLGSIQALALAAAGFGDDEPPDFVRERSLVLPTGWTGVGDAKGYVSVPMPLGLHVIPGVGRMITEFALSGGQDPAKRAVKLAGMFADAFNPVGNAGLSMQTIAPTVLDPLAALSENKDWTGKPIARVSFNKDAPGYNQHKDSATAVSKFLAELINTATGGNEYLAGVISPTPDQLDYLGGQVGGGVWRELSKVEQTVTNRFTGEETPVFKVPLLGRFIGSASDKASEGNAFYANGQKLNRLETQIKGLQKDGKIAEAAAMRAENPASRLIVPFNMSERRVQKLRKEKSDLIKAGADRERVKAIDDQITGIMLRMNESMKNLEAAS